jgi:hypothetical protein
MNRVHAFLGYLVAIWLCGFACGGGAPRQSGTPDEVEEKEEATGPAQACRDDGMEVEGLAGTIPQDEAERVFDRGMRKLLECYGEAVEDVEELEGTLELALTVDEAGRVEEAHLPFSDLGSVEAESCILKNARMFVFERGGCGKAYVNKRITLEAPYDPPDSLDWGRHEVRDTLKQNSDDISNCIGNRTGILVVINVGLGGVALAAGASADKFDDLEAGRCLAKASRRWVFNDPGEVLAKVRLEF